MDINKVAYIKNGIVKNVLSVPVLAPESFYIELFELSESDFYIIVTEETGDAFINGEWDGVHFRPVFATVEDNPVLSLMHWSAEARNMVPIKPCPKPGEMFYDPDQDEWFDIVQ